MKTVYLACVCAMLALGFLVAALNELASASTDRPTGIFGKEGQIGLSPVVTPQASGRGATALKVTGGRNIVDIADLRNLTARVASADTDTKTWHEVDGIDVGGPMSFSNTSLLPTDHATLAANGTFQKIILDSNVAQPMQLAVAPDGRVFFVERSGKVKIHNQDANITVLAAQLAVSTAFEDGLLGIALDPNFGSNQWVYLFYSPAGSIPKQHISRFTAVGDTLDLASERILLEVPTQRYQSPTRLDHPGLNTGQRPVLHRFRQCQPPHGVAQVVG